MNKFLLMIFSVSIFFIGIGGIVEQISTKFTSRKRHMIMLPRTETRIMEQERIDSGKSFMLIDKSNPSVLIESERLDKSGTDFQIKRRIPLQTDKKIELYRQPSSEPLRQGAEFPRVNEKDTVIFLDKHHEQIDTIEPTKSEIPQVRVYINKENKKQ